ncbi:MAG: glycosyltransferase family 2 protein [Candidatus Omnitrophica bacterium]|nr:glycosyltransferase family 2 protein [Candidatus Omnitrophota bacterium]
MSVPIVDTIVLTWNGLDLIRSFVESYRACTLFPTRLIIVDNASLDGTAEYLANLLSTQNCEIKVITNQENLGFVDGMNQGIRESHAAFVCLANNDLLFSPGWIDEIISVFERNPGIGLLNPNSNSLGARRKDNESLESFSLSLKKKYQGVFVELPFCIGFCMFIRRDVITKVGGLSSEFAPFYFEDTDYSLKTRKAGYLLGVAKGAYVWHQEHASFNQIKNKGEDVFAKNREIFRKKWGKILRILWIVDSHKEVSEALKDAIELARSGNYVWFMTGDMSRTREELFKGLGIFDHSGVNFNVARNDFSRIWMIVIKKKRYDVIICKNKLIAWVLKKFGFNVLSSFDKVKINDIKKA